jgi:protein-disulfide isomerase
MSIYHIWSLSLPGCGQGGGCEWAVSGPYSKVLGLPVAFVGVGYFASCLCLLALSRRSYPDRQWIWIIRAGAVASLVFVGIMLVNSRICVWCATVHTANLLHWAMAEKLAKVNRASNAGDLKNLTISALSGLVVLAGLIMGKLSVAGKVEEANRTKGVESINQIGADTVTQSTASDLPASDANSPTPSTPQVSSSPRFGGRYWEGNPDAPVRLVVFQDYQCKLCFEVEAVVAQLMASRNDVAFSVKQWPFDAACNRYMLGSSMHPGACEAAKVAEAAGMVGGTKAFWGMHHWLVDRSGQFSQTDLKRQLDKLGVDVDEFGVTFNGSEIDSMIQLDIEEGMAFGITYTPMIFVNGYRVEGWQSAGVLPAAIDRAAEVAKKFPRLNDRPDLAMDIQYRNWQNAPTVDLKLRADEIERGRKDASTTVLVYGDLSCVFHASARKTLDQTLGVFKDVRFVFRDFPLDKNCNPLVKQDINVRACQLVRWTHAVRRLAGDSAYWRAHDWIVHGRDQLENITIENLAAIAGLTAEQILEVASSPQVESDLKANLDLAIAQGVNQSPTIFVNGRQVSGWRTPGLLWKVIQAATKGAI